MLARSAALALLVFITTDVASAALVPVHVIATIDFIDPSLAAGFSSLGVVNGTTLSVTLTIDTSTPDSLPSDPTFGIYPAAVRSVSISAGGWSASTVGGFCCSSTPSANIYTLDRHGESPTDHWEVGIPHLYAPDSPSVVAGGIFTVGVHLFDEVAGTVMTSDSILPPSGARWRSGVIELIDGNEAAITARLGTAIVPEPPLGELIAGLFLLAGSARGFKPLSRGGLSLARRTLQPSSRAAR